MKFRILLSALVVFGLMSSSANALNPHILLEAIKKLLQKVDDGAKSAPKHADDLPSSAVLSKTPNNDLGLNGPLLVRSLARASHNLTCPSMSLRVSLPQLNVRIAVPSNLNVRSGPGTNYRVITKIGKAGIWSSDLLKTDACWVQVRWRKNNTGWIYSKLLEFDFDNHLTKPQRRLNRNLGADGVYKLVSRSTYKIETPVGQGTAVATSPTI